MDNPAVVPPLTVPPSPPPVTPQKSVIPLLLTILFLLALAATIILAIQNWRLNQKLEALIQSQPIIKTTNGTIEATVMRSPTCAGAQKLGEICETPVANETFKIIRPSDNEVIQTVTTDKNGKFAISLAVGTYKLQSSTGGVDKFGRIGGIGKMIDNPDFTINSGKTTTQQFDIDTGIR